MKKQKITTKPSANNEFVHSKMLCPKSKFQQLKSILVVYVKNSGITYFLDQLLFNLKNQFQKLQSEIQNQLPLWSMATMLL